LQPTPDTAPDEVVALVLAACRRSAAAAAEALWALGSPRLRRGFSSKADLERILTNDLFRPLIDSVAAEPEPLEVRDRAARQTVKFRAESGEEVSFLFALARTSRGESPECWLITGVERA
jgi:hypothetical protein